MAAIWGSLPEVPFLLHVGSLLGPWAFAKKTESDVQSVNFTSLTPWKKPCLWVRFDDGFCKVCCELSLFGAPILGAFGANCGYKLDVEQSYNKCEKQGAPGAR